jgi:hypothetical protein
VKSNSAQTIDRQADLVRFVQLARSTESVFETARFNHSRTSPNLHSTATRHFTATRRFTATQPMSGVFSKASLKRLVKLATQVASVSSTIWSSLKYCFNSSSAGGRMAEAPRVTRSA